MLKQARQIQEQLVAWRRDFHMHPELGFAEIRTAARVVEALEPLGYRIRSGVGKTGVVADFGQGTPIIAIRADMDALPIQESNQTPYASQTPGVMHACGHDAHTAIALGIATLLAQHTFSGTLRFLFQPAEETADEQGLSGAPRMIEDGAMEGVDAVLALHVDATRPSGDVDIGAGACSAGVDSFYATILGQGGHGAYPHTVIDPIYISGHIINALHGIVSRRLQPRDPAVISIGSIHGGEATNIIPQSVEMSGTIRYLKTTVREQIHAEIEQTLQISRALGGDYTLKIASGYPPMFNDAAAADLLYQVAIDLLGKEHIHPIETHMGAEDFGFFTNLAPGAMFLLGCRIEGDERKHHNPHFDIDESCLPIGAAILAQAALQMLQQST